MEYPSLAGFRAEKHYNLERSPLSVIPFRTFGLNNITKGNILFIEAEDGDLKEKGDAWFYRLSNVTNVHSVIC